MTRTILHWNTQKLCRCAVLLGLVWLTGCMNLYENRVESDYSYKGNFRKYKTFSFMEYKRSDSDSSLHLAIVEKMIRTRLQAQGYRYTENKPDILVSHRIFYEDFVLNGYNQADINIWLASGKKEADNDDEDNRSLNEEKKEYDPIKYSLTRGTLYVVLIDRKRNQSVWQGYASGLLGNKDFNNEGHIKKSVYAIFDKYKVFTEGYLLTNQEPRMD
ncbi:DUF4136 domain-containing protein [Adhaeribacter aquaticus]|uniref:DUF4136 domain-containing protein n=1 Tax=Adhaeribacter aquaticus TaxID=299567 RepID=UPI0003FCB9EA|nr:DUF4136 domain-containing protein [Adhaeribacter aquaticus]